MSFLQAEWRKLAFVNYVVDKNVLSTYLPAGTEFDLWNGKCFVSLVGMMFKNTRLLGVKVPYHIDFEEVNLRFYVKRLENGVYKKGVVFVKEIVPKSALTFVAKSIYNENYETLPMQHSWNLGGDENNVEYRFKKQEKWNSISVRTGSKSMSVEQDSEAEFIIERYWGYAEVDQNKSYEYEVKHSRWDVYGVTDYQIDVDFGSVYGKEFDFLNSLDPTSVMLTEGSLVTIENRRKIKVEDS
ncbi:MAG: DUF2071 domain-containing protein [Pricia sp.]